MHFLTQTHSLTHSNSCSVWCSSRALFHFKLTNHLDSRWSQRRHRQRQVDRLFILCQSVRARCYRFGCACSTSCAARPIRSTGHPATLWTYSNPARRHPQPRSSGTDRLSRCEATSCSQWHHPSSCQTCHGAPDHSPLAPRGQGLHCRRPAAH